MNKCLYNSLTPREFTIDTSTFYVNIEGEPGPVPYQDIVTFNSAFLLYQKLNAFVANKTKILNNEMHLRGSNNDKSLRAIKLNFELNRHFFELNRGICANASDVLMSFNQASIAELWAIEFGNNISYPVGGAEEYLGNSSKIMLWLNPRRWEYIDFMLSKCKEIMELLK